MEIGAPTISKDDKPEDRRPCDMETAPPVMINELVKSNPIQSNPVQSRLWKNDWIDQAKITALLKQADAIHYIPEFNQQDIEQFGQRAAYQIQLRFPGRRGTVRPREHQEIQERAEHDRAYNRARGGLPVCATCTSNSGGTVVKGHTADSSSCLYHVHVNLYQQHSRSAAEKLASQAALESDMMHGRL
jgi:hypothetical protein